MTRALSVQSITAMCYALEDFYHIHHLRDHVSTTDMESATKTNIRVFRIEWHKIDKDGVRENQENYHGHSV